MKSKILLLAVAAVMLLASGAMAYNFEIVEGGTVDVTGQSSIMFDVFFNPDAGGNSIGTYVFNLFYDTAELDWDALTTTNTPPSPLSAMFGNPMELASGHISNFNGASFVADASISSRTKLASVGFNILNPGAADGQADIWFDTDPFLTSTIDGQDVSMTAQNSINGADIAIVPEPVSTALFLVGGAVLGFRTLTRKRK